MKNRYISIVASTIFLFDSVRVGVIKTLAFAAGDDLNMCRCATPTGIGTGALLPQPVLIKDNGLSK